MMSENCSKCCMGWSRPATRCSSSSTISAADWIIDLGPEGGDAGGHIVATGTPEDVASSEASYTGQYLRPYLARTRPQRRRAG
jgi:hypothetical protein